MNFYLEDVINNIIDTEDVEKILEKIEYFKNISKYLICVFSNHQIYFKYTESLLTDNKLKIVFYCMDTEFDIFNCPTIMTYRKHYDKENNEMNYYILLICTKHKYRNQGYASKLLDEFIATIKEKHNKNKYNKVKIILSSIEEAVLFYEAYGFKWTKNSLIHHPFLMKYEKYFEEKEYFIMELDVNM